MEKRSSTKMFDNPILELLSKSNPPLMIGFHILLAGTILFLGIRINHFNLSLGTIILIFSLGIITWSLTEYLMHRFLFHFERENRLIKAFHYAMHGHHHKNPNDKSHMFMPPLPAFIFVMVFLGLFYLIMWDFAFFFLPGFEIGYLIYSLIHFSVHNYTVAKGPFQKLWIHHAKHHYQSPEKAFGVSSTFWDFVFDTLPKDEKSTRETTS